MSTRHTSNASGRCGADTRGDDRELADVEVAQAVHDRQASYGGPLNHLRRDLRESGEDARVSGVADAVHLLASVVIADGADEQHDRTGPVVGDRVVHLGDVQGLVAYVDQPDHIAHGEQA